MFRIKKLDIFITKQFGLLFLGTFFICLFVLMMQFLWRYVDEMIGKGLSMEVLAQFFWYMGLGLMPQAFPLAILLSSLIAYGNLGESSELTAIKAAGISLMQSMRSLIVFVCLIAGISFFFQNIVVPYANRPSQMRLTDKNKADGTKTNIIRRYAVRIYKNKRRNGNISRTSFVIRAHFDILHGNQK